MREGRCSEGRGDVVREGRCSEGRCSEGGEM